MRLSVKNWPYWQECGCVRSSASWWDIKRSVSVGGCCVEGSFWSATLSQKGRRACWGVAYGGGRCLMSVLSAD